MSYGGGVGVCLTGARFSMSATLLHQGEDYVSPEDEINLELYGEWVRSQDPLTKEIVRKWIPYDEAHIPDDPTTHDYDEEVKVGTIPCVARGIVDGGIRVAGTTERFGAEYENIDYVRFWVPTWVRISKADRVTNIADANGHIRWRDEEFATLGEEPRATVFNVNGVTPLFNAFNVATEQFVLLERAEVRDEI